MKSLNIRSETACTIMFRRASAAHAARNKKILWSCYISSSRALFRAVYLRVNSKAKTPKPNQRRPVQPSEVLVSGASCLPPYQEAQQKAYRRTVVAKSVSCATAPSTEVQLAIERTFSFASFQYGDCDS
eukprot:5192657-Pleurochrysis_carterae.AAC.1